MTLFLMFEGNYFTMSSLQFWGNGLLWTTNGKKCPRGSHPGVHNSQQHLDYKNDMNWDFFFLFFKIIT